jgi:hypothetical protein
MVSRGASEAPMVVNSASELDMYYIRYSLDTVVRRCKSLPRIWDVPVHRCTDVVLVWNWDGLIPPFGGWSLSISQLCGWRGVPVNLFVDALSSIWLVLG